MPLTVASMAFFNNQGQITPKWLVWSGQNSNSSEIVTCKFDKDLINNERASVETSFSHCGLWKKNPVLKGA